jgi:MFS family permease
MVSYIQTNPDILRYYIKPPRYVLEIILSRVLRTYSIQSPIQISVAKYCSILSRFAYFPNIPLILLGDWLNEIGCITIINEMTDSGTLVSLYMVARELPALIWNPVVGVAADTFDRKKILIIADLVRSAIVLLFLLVRPTKSIWLLYILVTFPPIL